MIYVCELKHDRYLTAADMFRGRMSPKELNEKILNVKSKNNLYFVETIYIYFLFRKRIKLAVSFIGNSIAIQELLQNNLL